MHDTGEGIGFPSVGKPWHQYYSTECLNAGISDGCLYDCLYLYNENYLSDIFI